MICPTFSLSKATENKHFKKKNQSHISRGLGYMIVKASGLYDMATVLVGVVALIVIAIFLTFVIERIENRLLRWKEA
jgi:ABC-type nitrate/sulfonate/bicarbonate transport system permease component